MLEDIEKYIRDVVGFRVENINVLVGENEMSYLKLMKIKVISRAIYTIMDSQLLVGDYLLNFNLLIF
jgi:hypothetical protein